jgi:hypothetical protein
LRRRRSAWRPTASGTRRPTHSAQRRPTRPPATQELEVLDEDARVFKLIGPALVRQEQPEAAANVRKRLDFIAAEVSRLDARAAALEEKAGKRQAALQQMQAEAQRLQAQAQQQQQQQGGGGGA